jgi:hypothetical protein
MKNAKELMLEYTASSIRDPKKAAEMFVSCHVRNSLTVQGPRRDRRSFPIRARSLSRFPIREYQGADRYSRPGFWGIRVHRGVQQNGTIRSSALLCAPGRREWKDQPVERSTE